MFFLAQLAPEEPNAVPGNDFRRRRQVPPDGGRAGDFRDRKAKAFDGDPLVVAHCLKLTERAGPFHVS